MRGKDRREHERSPSGLLSPPSPAQHSRANLEVHSLPLWVGAELMLWKTSSVKGHVGVSLLLPQEVLEVTQRRLRILDGLRGGK